MFPNIVDGDWFLFGIYIYNAYKHRLLVPRMILACSRLYMKIKNCYRGTQLQSFEVCKLKSKRIRANIHLLLRRNLGTSVSSNKKQFKITPRFLQKNINSATNVRHGRFNVELEGGAMLPLIVKCNMVWRNKQR